MGKDQNYIRQAMIQDLLPIDLAYKKEDLDSDNFIYNAMPDFIYFLVMSFEEN